MDVWELGTILVMLVVPDVVDTFATFVDAGSNLVQALRQCFRIERWVDQDQG